MHRGKAKTDYETGMKMLYDPISRRMVVSFRGRLTVLPSTYDDEAEAIEAGELHCREQGWAPQKDKQAGAVRRAWD